VTVARWRLKINVIGQRLGLNLRPARQTNRLRLRYRSRYDLRLCRARAVCFLVGVRVKVEGQMFRGSVLHSTYRPPLLSFQAPQSHYRATLSVARARSPWPLDRVLQSTAATCSNDRAPAVIMNPSFHRPFLSIMLHVFVENCTRMRVGSCSKVKKVE